MSNLGVGSGHLPPRAASPHRPASPSAMARALAEPPAVDGLSPPAATLPAWGGSGPRSTLPRPPRPQPLSAGPSPFQLGWDGALALAGGTGHPLYEQCRVELDKFGEAKQRELVATVKLLLGQAAQVTGEAVLHWLRAVARPNYLDARHVAQAVQRAGLTGIDVERFHLMRGQLRGLARRSRGVFAQEAAAVAARATAGDAGVVMVRCLELVGSCPKERQQLRTARFLSAWLPRHKLHAARLAKAAGLLARLDEDTRRLWGDALGDVLSFAEASGQELEQLFAALDKLATRGRGLAPRLRMLLAREVADVLERLPLPERLSTVVVLLRMHSDLPGQAALLLSLGGDRVGPGAPRAHQVLDVALGGRIESEPAVARRFVDASLALCRVAPASAHLALMRLLAYQSPDDMPACGAAMRAIVAALLSPQGGHITPAQLAAWAERLRLSHAPSRLALWQICAGGRMQALCAGLPGQVRLDLVGEALKCDEGEAERALEVVEGAKALACGWWQQAAPLAAILRQHGASLAADLYFCLPFCRRATDDDLPPLVESLCEIPAAERELFATLCQPILASDMADEVVPYLIDYCAAGVEHISTPEHRAARWQQRVETCMAFHPNRLPDRENVQSHLRIDRTRSAIVALMRRFGASVPGDRQQTHDQVVSYVRAWRRRAPGSPADAVLQRRWAGDDVVGNALRMLEGPPDDADLTVVPLLAPGRDGSWLSLREAGDVGIDELAHLVWRAIDAYAGAPEARAREQDNMRYSFMMALALCVEQHEGEPGKVVCPVGVSQRLMQVLQGYDGDTRIDHHTPQQLLSSLGQRFCHEAGDSPSEAAVAAFRHRAAAQAAQLYPVGSAEFGQFARDLDAWLEML